MTATIIVMMFVLGALGPDRINSIAPYVRASAKPTRSPLWARVLFPIMFAFFAYMIFRIITESTVLELIWLAALLAYTGRLYWASWRIKRIRHRHRRYRPLASVALLAALVGGYWLLTARWVGHLSFDWRHAAQLPINIGGGQIPTKRHFERLRGPLWIALYGIHDNPRFYMHYWKIWTRMDAIPGEDLPDFKRRFGPYPWLVIVPELSFSEAITNMKQLCDRGERFMVATSGLNTMIRRRDGTSP